MIIVKKIYKTVVLFCLLFSSGALGTDLMLEDKKKHPPVSFLIRSINKIQDTIAKSHQEADPNTLRAAHTQFKSLEYKEEQWAQIAQQLNAYTWSQQDWQQTVGGHLFYPWVTHDWLDSPYTEHLIQRSDMIWAFAIAACYRHPLGQYYLAHTLDKIRRDYSDAERPDFFNKLYKASLTTLVHHLDYNDACYALGRSKLDYPYIGKHCGDTEEAEIIFKKGTDFRNQFAAIFFQSEKLRQKKYLELAQKGYPRAYREAANYAATDEEKKALLGQAIDLGYVSALIDLGYLYKKKNDFESAIDCYKEAANKGISEGYIQHGILLVGDITCDLEERNKNLSILSPDDIEHAVQLFTLAGQAKNPEGWEYLAALKMKLYQQTKTRELGQNIYDALVEGIKLGSDRAYHEIYCHFASHYLMLVETYGYPPQEWLYKQVELFIGKN